MNKAGIHARVRKNSASGRTAAGLIKSKGNWLIEAKVCQKWEKKTAFFHQFEKMTFFFAHALKKPCFWENWGFGVLVMRPIVWLILRVFPPSQTWIPRLNRKIKIGVTVALPSKQHFAARRSKRCFWRLYCPLLEALTGHLARGLEQLQSGCSFFPQASSESSQSN